MDRREAMLREMNLYPLWVRRSLPALAEIVSPLAAPATVLSAAEPSAVSPVAVPVVPLEPVVSTKAVRQEVAAPQPAELPAPQDESAGSSEETPPADLFAAPDHEGWAGMPFCDHEEAEDTLREFQRKVAAGPLAGLDWPELKQKVHDCELCKLRAGCTQTVFGVGDQQADWLVVGEGPGAEEDAQGEPFVGQAGRLLDNMLASIGLKRGNNVYIANVVKCRPPNNRNPLEDEIAACRPYLQRQIELVRPRLIVALGKVAATTLLNRDATISSLRGRLHDYRGVPLLVTYHPAYLLRSPIEKARAWQDLCLAVETMAGLPEREKE